MSVAEVGALIGLAVGIATLIGIAVRVGMAAGRIEEAQKTLNSRLGALDTIPELTVRVGSVEQFQARNTSDIRELDRKVAHLRGENTGRFRALSEPDLEET